MEPKKVGRILGAGVRVASKMVHERMVEAQASPAGAVFSPAPAAKSPHARTATAKRGLKAFAQGVLGPFRHAGGVLWLEITGLFFALFTLFFLQNIYRVRGALRPGADHRQLLLYVALAVAFAWFSFSSFQRAYRKSRQGAAAARVTGR